MLSARNRLRRGDDIRRVVRRGRRRVGRLLIAYVGSGEGDADRFAFIVGKGVGSAPQRNLVRRRLRHLCRNVVAGSSQSVNPRSGGAPRSDIVIRALPAAVDASWTSLQDELARALSSSTSRPS